MLLRSAPLPNIYLPLRVCAPPRGALNWQSKLQVTQAKQTNRNAWKPQEIRRICHAVNCSGKKEQSLLQAHSSPSLSYSRCLPLSLSLSGSASATVCRMPTALAYA